MRSELRKDFPLLERRIDGNPIVYLDSAATALKPRQVLDAERRYGTEFTANIHRGKHALSEEASNAYENARRRVARFLGADPSNVAFVRNATEGINLVASGLGLTKDDTVLCGVGDHHSNIVPWMQHAQVRFLEGDPLAKLTPQALEAAILRHKPRVYALGWASNVTGVVQDAAALCAVARKHGVLSVIDAAQAAPHLAPNVRELGCDFLAFSGHKLLGPTGIGALYGAPERLEALAPLLAGGGTVERVTAEGFTWKKLPYRLEAGTPNVSGAIGLAAALDYLDDVGFEALAAHDRALADALAAGLEGLPGARVLMAQEPDRLAIASIALTTKTISADHLAVLLSDGSQMMLRSGFHCAHPIFDALELPNGALRASAYVYNTIEEIERFTKVLRSLLSRFTG